MSRQKEDFLHGAKGQIVLGLPLKVDKMAADYHTNVRRAEILMVVSMVVVILMIDKNPGTHQVKEEGEHHSAVQHIEETIMGLAAAVEIAGEVVIREIAIAAITHMKKIKSHHAVTMMAIIYTEYLQSD